MQTGPKSFFIVDYTDRIIKILSRAMRESGPGIMKPTNFISIEMEAMRGNGALIHKSVFNKSIKGRRIELRDRELAIAIVLEQVEMIAAIQVSCSGSYLLQSRIRQGK